MQSFAFSHVSLDKLKHLIRRLNLNWSYNNTANDSTHNYGHQYRKGRSYCLSHFLSWIRLTCWLTEDRDHGDPITGCWNWLKVMLNVICLLGKDPEVGVRVRDTCTAQVVGPVSWRRNGQIRFTCVPQAWSLYIRVFLSAPSHGETGSDYY